MRQFLIACAVLVAPSAAFADDDVQTTPMTAMDAAAKPCAAILAIDNAPAGGAAPKCTRVSTLKVAGLGNAELYSVIDTGNAWSRYAFVVAIDGKSWVSQPVDIVADCAMGGKCDNPGKVTPKLRAITIASNPAIALEVDAKMAHVVHSMDTGKQVSNRPWLKTAFVACARKGDAPACAATSFGTADQSCTASLDATGTIAHRCDGQDAKTALELK